MGYLEFTQVLLETWDITRWPEKEIFIWPILKCEHTFSAWQHERWGIQAKNSKKYHGQKENY